MQQEHGIRNLKAAAATTQLRKLLANETSLKGFKKLGLEFSLLGKEVRSFLIIGENRSYQLQDQT